MLFSKLMDKFFPKPSEDAIQLEGKWNPLEEDLQKQVKELAIAFEGNQFVVTGKVEKMFVSIPFRIAMRIVEVKERVIRCEIADVKPLNFEFINRMFADRPPVMSYRHPELMFDLDAIEAVKEFPFGQLRAIQIEDRAVTIKIGF